jgi:hypothetical protein
MKLLKQTKGSPNQKGRRIQKTNSPDSVSSANASSKKRGRPRKMEKTINLSPVHQISDQEYTAEEEESLKAHLRKTIDLFKIRSVKGLMSNMYAIKKYV